MTRGALFPLLLLLFSTLASCPTPGSGAGLNAYYYARRCRGLDGIVTTRLRQYYKQDPGLVAALLRLVFHDCFSVGCDASILLAGEVTHPFSETLNGFDVIEDLKAQVEKRCPGVVSCADLLVLAARDAVRASGGPNILTKYGRRDAPRAYPGAVSSQAVKETMNVSSLVRKFRAIGLNSRDLVALSGAHSIGKGHCSAIADRLSPKSPLPMNTRYKANLQRTCRGGGLGVNSPTVDMDPSSPFKFDNLYYKNLLANMGLFTSDQTLMTNAGTAKVVRRFAGDQRAFFSQFAKSFVRMTEIGVLTGSRGSIRKYCSMG